MKKTAFSHLTGLSSCPSSLMVLLCLAVSTSLTSAATFSTFTDRAAFVSALDSTIIDDDLEQFNNLEIDFDNSSVNTSTSGPTLSGYDLSHVGDEVTTQFVSGDGTNGAEIGNSTVNIQFILDLAGLPGAFGVNSATTDIATITVANQSVNAFGFDPFGFNDQGLDFVNSPQALGVEIGVLTTVRDTLGNTESFTIASTDAFFGVVGLEAPIQDIVFSAVANPSGGVEFISLDNFVGGASSIPEPTSAALIAVAGLGLLGRRRRS